MLAKEILQKLDLGSSVAEFDSALDNYFVETQSFRTVVQDKADIVAGDKGTGKTALYRILQSRATQLPELTKIMILPAFNPEGSLTCLVGAGLFRLGRSAKIEGQRYHASFDFDRTFSLRSSHASMTRSANNSPRNLRVCQPSSTSSGTSVRSICGVTWGNSKRQSASTSSR